MTWRVAVSLDILLAEINRQWPGRSKRSDGSIGDTAHAARKSDHNPVNGVVKARDYDITSLSSRDAQRLADHIRDVMVARNQLGYVIFNGCIANPSIGGGRWREYNGSNKHTKHIHVSVHSQTDRGASWGIASVFTPKPTPKPVPVPDKQEEDMPLTDTDVNKIVAALVPALTAKLPAATWKYSNPELYPGDIHQVVLDIKAKLSEQVAS